MDQLITISGYANTSLELCSMKNAKVGDYYNAFDQFPFMTYRKTSETKVGDTGKTTDVLGWFQTIDELKENVKALDGDVYIVGDKPYTRMKAVATGNGIEWEEDGTETIKIVQSFKDVQRMGHAKFEVKEGIYCAIGKQLPLAVYGLLSVWEPVGMYTTLVVSRFSQLKVKRMNRGDVGCADGIFYMYDGNQWHPLLNEPVKNVFKHTYYDGERHYMIREGLSIGTIELFTPREFM